MCSWKRPGMPLETTMLTVKNGLCIEVPSLLAKYKTDIYDNHSMVNVKMYAFAHTERYY